MRDSILALLQKWTRCGNPTREVYLQGARELEAHRIRSPWGGLWPRSPLMITATLDDGWGHGLGIIEALASAVGISIHSMGVLQPPSSIVQVCCEKKPDLLGLTVLQFDSDDAVREINAGLPPMTTLIAGGAAYRYDPDFAERSGTRAVARDGRAFLHFLLHYQPGEPNKGPSPA